MLRQTLSVASNNLRMLPARWGASLVVVVGMTGVVSVMVAILAMAHGFQQTLGRAARADRVIVMGAGEDNGMLTAVTREQVPIVLDAPGFARDGDGRPLASAQKFMTSTLRERKGGAQAYLTLRGVGEKAFKVWPEVKIVEGRAFTPGKRELIAGRGARWQFQGVEIGQDVEMINGPWWVVGVFEAGGSVLESELWGDAEMVFPGYSMTGHFSSVTGLLESDAAFQPLAEWIGTNPKLGQAVRREADYYASLSGQMVGMIRTLGYLVAAIMALGALLSAGNTMYAAVKARALEIATLRAIGFGAAPVVLSVLLEAAVLCVTGALLGAGLAWLIFNGHTISTLNWQGGGQVAFAFQVSGGMLLQCVIGACAIGLLGGLFPAMRAARLPVVDALRAGS
jgi:putative ABC transport system permease protein